MGLRTETLMGIHGHRIELLQTIHGFQEDNNHTTTLYGFNGTTKQIGSHSFKILFH